MGCQRASGGGYPAGSGQKPKGAASKASAKKPATATGEAFQAPVYVEREKAETPAEKRIRALRKKVREIDALEERIESTECIVTPEMEQKIASKPALEKEIEQLKRVAALEVHEAGVTAAQEAAKAAAKAAADEAAAAKAAAEAEAAAAKAAAAKKVAEEKLAQQRREALEVLANISPNSKEAQGDARLQELLKQVGELSEDIFHENCVGGGQGAVSKKSGWKLTLLARPVPEDPSNAPPEDPTKLLGFIVYRLRPDYQCLSVAKIAVPEEHRSRGFGRYLMDWVVKYAQKQGNLLYLSLSSLPDAVKFYQRFGFKSVNVSAIREDDCELIEGQVYMEYQLKAGKRGGSKK